MSTLYILETQPQQYREATPSEIIACAQALISQRFRAGAPALTDPRRTREYLKLHLAPLEHEVFGILHLDTRHRLIAAENLFRGTIDGASVHPREVVRAVLNHNTAAVILYHNHPSGVAEASQADELITRRLQQSLALIDVRVLDHLVIGETIYSFAERGLIGS